MYHNNIKKLAAANLYRQGWAVGSAAFFFVLLLFVPNSNSLAHARLPPTPMLGLGTVHLERLLRVYYSISEDVQASFSCIVVRDIDPQ